MEKLGLSNINIPVSLNLKELESMINQQVDEILNQNVDLAEEAGDDLVIRAKKAEEITISFGSSSINYRIPMKLWVKKIVPITFLELEVEGTIAISMSTKFKIGEDWKLETHTEVVEHEWLQKPQLRIGLFELPIKFILNTVINKTKNLVCVKLDEGLANNFDLRKVVEEGWEMLQKPILVAEDFDLWLNLNPSQIGMTPFMSDSEILKSTLMVQTFVSATMGKKPFDEDENPLPSFQLSAKSDEAFRLHLKTEIAYSEAEKTAKKYTIGQEIKTGLFRLKIEDVNLMGEAEKVVVKFRFSGFYNGIFSFKGLPIYLKDLKEIQIKSPDYYLKTRNVFVLFFNWLFRGLIKRYLRKKLRFPLTPSLNEFVKRSGEVLKDFEVTDGVFLNGKLCELEFEAIETNEKALTVVIKSAGNLNLFVDKLDIQKATQN